MSFIKRRRDVSEWLIHFVRDRVPELDFPGDEQESEALVGDIKPDAPATSVLDRIVRLGGLLPGFSFRSGNDGRPRTTIYGGAPVVCFTEAPLEAFAQYVNDRGNEARCSPYAVCLLKSEVYAAGGRPVIYGLAGGDSPPLTKDTRDERIIDASYLPLKEQFRYVAYDPNRTRPLDWTHEREWRWMATDKERHSLWYDGPLGFEAYPGLSLFFAEGFFSQVGLITKTKDEAMDLAAILLRYRDAGQNDFGTPYSEKVLAQSFVVPLDEALRSGASRIEDLAPTYRLVAARTEPTAQLIEQVRRAVDKARAASVVAAKEFLASAQRTPSGHVADVCGGAWVITRNSTSPITAALLSTSLAETSGGEYYIVDAIGQGPGEMANAACKSLCADLGNIFTVKTWWD